ncbi:MAG: 16S rRNA (cytidine(1402)-2'-O)-methyltransferase [Bacteroidia bacterium]
MTSGSAASSGRLLLVATPLGNLGDITVRSLEALRSADAVLCEDTRRTGLLFKLLGINAPLQPYHAHNEHAVLTRVVEQIRNGRTIVLVSDAGTPGVSDPGFLLVRALLEQGLEVDVLPGPTALIPALLLSGFPCDRFVFEGFLPLKKGRKTRIESLRSESRTVVLYESPHRILRTLGELKTALGPERRACLARELTKLHQETLRLSLGELEAACTQRPPKGEMVLVIEGAKARTDVPESREAEEDA